MIGGILKNLKTLKIGMSEGYTGEKTEHFDPWDRLYTALIKGEILQGKVDGAEDEHLVIFFESIKGIIPNEEIGEPRPKFLSVLVGAPVAYKVTNCDRAKNVVYLSRKAALTEMSQFTWKELRRDCERLLETQEKMEALRPREENKELSVEEKRKMAELNNEARKEGPTRTGTVRAVVEEGAYLDIGGVPAFLPTYEISWGKVLDARDVLHPGESYDIKIIRVDFGKGLVRASLRALQPNPWETVPQRYLKGGKYGGQVKWIARGGSLAVELEPGVVAFCKSIPMTDLKPGTSVRVHIARMDLEKRFIRGNIVGESRWVG